MTVADTFERNENRQSNNFLADFPVTELIISGKLVRAKVDTADLQKLLSHSTRWHAHYCHESRTFYVKARHAKTQLHRIVVDAPPGLTVDHINHDGLDNRQANLRVCPQSKNSQNCRHAIGECGFHGVTKRRNGKYRASVMRNWKRVLLGEFSTPELAGEAVREFLRRESEGL